MSQIQAERARAAFAARWARIAARFFTLQIAIQAVNFTAGMLAVWQVAPSEYALVTVAITMLGTMTILANLGVSIGITSIGGRVHDDPVRFGALVRTGLRLRWLLAAIALPATALALVLSLAGAHAAPAAIAVITALVLAGAACELTSSQMAAVLMLRDRVDAVQAIELGVAALRLALVGALYAGGGLAATTLVAASLAASLARRWLIGRRVAREVDLHAAEVPSDRTEMLRLMRLEAPNSLFFCFQGQIALWILAWFGAVEQIAGLGALGRLAVVVGVLGAFFSAVLVQGFARLQDPAGLRRRYAGLASLALAIAIAVVGAVWLLPGPVLWALGPHYRGLGAELPLMAINLMLGFLVNVVWGLNASKAWIGAVARGNIIATVAVQAALATLLDLRTLSGVIIFTIVAQIPNLLLCLIDAYRGLAAARRGGLVA